MTRGNTYRTTRIRLLLLLTLGAAVSAQSQTFDSGSTGADGALDFTGQSGTIVFNPADFNPPLDPEADNIYHFTTITIPNGVTVKLSADILGTSPVVWLATGDVEISGRVDLNGASGHGSGNNAAFPAIAGAGGYSGGIGRRDINPARAGDGPGGGLVNAGSAGGGAGHAILGGGSGGGSAYGNDFLLPMIGGSGGAGSDTTNGYGGGAGGGAILIASSTQIRIAGSLSYIRAIGGGSTGGGGGSGGAIRLMAPVLDIGGGSVLATGGGGNGINDGSPGRIRLEAYQLDISGVINPTPSIGVPITVFVPADSVSVRITSIDGVAAPANPTGSRTNPDMTLNDTTTASIALEAKKIPLGTMVDVTLVPDTGSPVTVQSTPLAGTFELSTATATVTIPHGFSRFTVQADWMP